MRCQGATPPQDCQGHTQAGTRVDMHLHVDQMSQRRLATRRDTDPHMGSQSRPSFLCVLDPTPLSCPILPHPLCHQRAPLSLETSTCPANTGRRVTETFLSPHFAPFPAKFGPASLASLPHASPGSHLPKTTFKAPVAYAAFGATQEGGLRVSECWRRSAHKAKTNLLRLHWGN